MLKILKLNDQVKQLYLLHKVYIPIVTQGTSM